MSNCIDIPKPNNNLGQNNYSFGNDPFKNSPPSNNLNVYLKDYGVYNCDTPPEFYKLFTKSNQNKQNLMNNS